jgi:hypothetical protein
LLNRAKTVTELVICHGTFLDQRRFTMITMKRFPILAALSASALLLANQAFAAVPADVTTAIADA